MNIRNIAIIAHVDHGKTTLVDAFLKQTHTFQAHQQVQERVLDSNDLERERGITILAKNISVQYRDTKINIVDTPGHADFGGEVERILGMVDGALLVVDAVEGAMPQTRFVVQKALQKGLAPILVVNKIDRPAADPERVVDEVFDLLVALGADEQQLDFPVFYASALRGRAGTSVEATEAGEASITPILDGVLQYVPAPAVTEGPLQMMVANLDYDDYVGRLAVGRMHGGCIRQGQDVVLTHSGRSEVKRGKISQLYTFQGLKRVAASKVESGDIAAFSGIDFVEIGHTVNDPERPLALPAIEVDEPTLTMVFRVNDGPMSGQDGKYLTSRHLRERLWKEAQTNVALRVEDTELPEKFRVSGRGELHLSVLIETMRREGYEFCVSRPEPILKRTESGVEEPFELLVVDIPQEYMGTVMELVGERRGEMQNMQQLGEDQVRLEFSIPARGLLGFTSLFLTETRGYGIMYHTFSHYGTWAGEIPGRSSGSLVAWEAGEATAYALLNLEQRGQLFIGPGAKVYAGMVVGANSRGEDLEVNVAKKKQATNMRSAGSDDTVKLTPPRVMHLEEAIGFLAEDEYLEVTPMNLRLRKATLDRHARERQRKSS